MNLHKFIPLCILFLSGAYAQAAPPFVTYAGQVASGGQPFNGTGQFKFAFVNADANVTYWSHDGTSTAGSEPTAYISVPVNGGYYSILLGNTAMSGMGAINPAIFKTYSDIHLRVWFSDGVAAFQEMTPHRPFASVPYALNAGVAVGSITKSMLGSDVLADLNRTITVDMLSPTIKNDLNRTITKSMLGSDVLADLNRTITVDMLSPTIKNDLNRTITKSMLGSDVLADLNATPSNGSITKSMLSSDVLTDLNRTQSVVGTSDDAFTEGLRAYLRPMLAGGVWHSWGLSGMPVTLKAPKVDGRFLTYQWYKGGSPISGATGTEYVIPDFNATRDSGDYEIRVSNAFATLKTKAVLQVGIGSGLDGRVGLGGVYDFGNEDSSTLLIKSSGSAVGSGRNFSGEIGQGTSSQYLSPVASLFSDGNRSNELSAVTAGFGHALYLKSDGTLYGVGANGNGQLGDGTTTPKKYLTPIPNVGNVAQVSAGKSHAMFVKTDGTLWGTGDQ